MVIMASIVPSRRRELRIQRRWRFVYRYVDCYPADILLDLGPRRYTVFDVDAHGDQLFVVMELLEGQPLSRLIDGKPLKLVELLDLADQIQRSTGT
jgi:hypothetical protein